MADTPNSQSGSKPGRKELSTEVRLLIAFLLMGAVLFLTPYFYKPAAPPPKTSPAKEIPAEQTKVPEAEPSKPAQPPPMPVPGQISAQTEELLLVETDLYRIEFSNRGAVVRRWTLKGPKYVDSRGRPLELINQEAAAKVGYPFSVDFKEKPSTDVNNALFITKRSDDGLSLEFEFSDGKTALRKSFHFTRDSYLSKVSSEAVQNGVPMPHFLTWRGGFGDPSLEHAAPSQHTVYYDTREAELVLQEAKHGKDGPVTSSGDYSFAGIEDQYFAAVSLPPAGAVVEMRTYGDSVPTAGGSEDMRVGAGIGGGAQNRFTLFVGPKDLDLLRRIEPKLAQLIDFGWFAFLAKPLFLALNWVNDNLAHNYGWAIVIVTVVINFLMLPLRYTSMKSMKKMQSLQPQIKAINEKYKGIGLRDPRKAEQNQEVMALYKQHGVNPTGGCFPMLLQIPFFFAFYKVLTVAIELRGANWLWVTDLSQPEHLPIRILPITMIITQFIQQKMTPSTMGDPTQQRIMMMMPLMLGFMFYGVSSGLVLYWLTGNVIGIAQQWFFNKTMATPAPVVSEPKVVSKRRSKK